MGDSSALSHNYQRGDCSALSHNHQRGDCSALSHNYQRGDCSALSCNYQRGDCSALLHNYQRGDCPALPCNYQRGGCAALPCNHPSTDQRRVCTNARHTCPQMQGWWEQARRNSMSASEEQSCIPGDRRSMEQAQVVRTAVQRSCCTQARAHHDMNRAPLRG
eukprot:1150358-Pelagomonas_calceolata.AAC.1